MSSVLSPVSHASSLSPSTVWLSVRQLDHFEVVLDPQTGRYGVRDLMNAHIETCGTLQEANARCLMRHLEYIHQRNCQMEWNRGPYRVGRAEAALNLIDPRAHD
jgi:hypothetical protein